MNAMSHFSEYRQDLTLLTLWLRKPHMRQRFVNTCLIGEFADLQDWFHHFWLKVDTHRWGVVLDGTCEVLQLEEPLRKGFQEDEYGNNVQAGEETVNLSKLAEIIGSNFFWAYARMIATCGRTLQSIAAWAEGCSCHSPREVSEPCRTIFRKGGTSGSATKGSCPLAGMRAPELAAGSLGGVSLVGKNPLGLLALVHLKSSGVLCCLEATKFWWQKRRVFP